MIIGVGVDVEYYNLKKEAIFKINLNIFSLFFVGVLLVICASASAMLTGSSHLYTVS